MFFRSQLHQMSGSFSSVATLPAANVVASEPCWIALLPDEVLVEIFARLDYSQLRVVGKVCRKWAALVPLSREKFTRHYGLSQFKAALGKALSHESGGKPTHQEISQLSLELEETLFKSEKHCGLKAYQERLRSLAFNLSKNSKLAEQLLCGSLSTAALVQLNLEELAPPQIKLAREEHRKRKMREVIYRPDEMLMKSERKSFQPSQLFHCDACGSRACVYYAWRTRQQVERGEIFVRCTNCGNRWEC